MKSLLPLIIACIAGVVLVTAIPVAPDCVCTYNVDNNLSRRWLSKLSCCGGNQSEEIGYELVPNPDSSTERSPSPLIPEGFRHRENPAAASSPDKGHESQKPASPASTLPTPSEVPPLSVLKTLGRKGKPMLSGRRHSRVRDSNTAITPPTPPRNTRFRRSSEQELFELEQQQSREGRAPIHGLQAVWPTITE